MPTFALVTPDGTTLGPFELDDDEPGAIIRRPGQPDRRVIGRLDDEDEELNARRADRRARLTSGAGGAPARGRGRDVARVTADRGASSASA